MRAPQVPSASKQVTANVAATFTPLGVAATAAQVLASAAASRRRRAPAGTVVELQL
jgi:hypothetical protein